MEGGERADLRNTDLRGADLEFTYSEYADLRGAKLYSCILYKAERNDLYGVENIGSRNDTTHYFVNDDRVICGCFDSTMEEFEDKVKDTYSEGSREYKEYVIAIDTLKRYRDMYLEE